MVDEVKKKDGDVIEVVGLRRQIGFIGGLAILLGHVIGSGIFISPKGVLAGAGSVGVSLIMWAVCGIIAMSGGFCYAEMGCMFPRSGSAYNYFFEAFGRVPAFLLGWFYIVISYPLSICIMSLTCAQYTLAPFFDDGCGSPPSTLAKLTAAVYILITAAVNVYSVKWANKINIVLTQAKVVALVIIILGGIYNVYRGYTSNFHPSSLFRGTNTNPGQIATGLYSGLWAFSGWQAPANIAGEIINPKRILPLVILVGNLLIMALYLLTNVSYFTVLSPEQLLDSPAVALTWIEHTLPQLAWLVPLCVAISTLGSTLGSMITIPRTSYALSRDGMWDRLASMVHVHFMTPLPATLSTTFLCMIVLMFGEIGTLLNAIGITDSLINIMIPISLFTLRWKRKSPRAYKVSLVWPSLMLVSLVTLVTFSLVKDLHLEYIYGLTALAAGLLVYIPVVHYNISLPGYDTFVMFVQLLTQVSPTELDN